MKILNLLLVLLVTSCSSVFYQPSAKHFIEPRKQLKVEYEDVYFPSLDGTKLHGWFIPTRSKTTKGTIVQFHGNAENISTHFLSLVWLIEYGYNIFIFDYRGYGKSEGTSSQKGVYLDSLAGLEKGFSFFEKHGAGKFIVFGQSLGGIIALRALPDYSRKEKISLLVLDSTFASYQDIAFDKLSHSWLLFWLSPLSYALISDEYAADKVMKKVKNPVLVIVGQKDPVIPQKFGKKIFKDLETDQKWLWKLPNGSHIDGFHHDKGVYRAKFLKFLDGISQR